MKIFGFGVLIVGLVLMVLSVMDLSNAIVHRTLWNHKVLLVGILIFAAGVQMMVGWC